LKFKVKFERGACILASGLNKDKIKGFNHCGPMTNVTIEFVQNLMEELPAIHCPGTPEGSKIHFKASIHTGPATGVSIPIFPLQFLDLKQIFVLGFDWNYVLRVPPHGT
jgi:hypothetical protein